jgi:hypothetical protein
MAIVLHKWDESLEVSMEARNRMRDYDRNVLEIEKIEYASEEEIEDERTGIWESSHTDSD